MDRHDFRRSDQVQGSRHEIALSEKPSSSSDHPSRRAHLRYSSITPESFEQMLHHDKMQFMQQDIQHAEASHEMLSLEESLYLHSLSHYPVRNTRDNTILEYRIAGGDASSSYYAFGDLEDPRGDAPLHFTNDPNDRRFLSNSNRYILIRTENNGNDYMLLLSKKDTITYVISKTHEFPSFIREHPFNHCMHTPPLLPEGPDTVSSLSEGSSLPGGEPSSSHRQGKEHAEPLSNQQMALDPCVTQELARLEAYLLNDDIPESSPIIPPDGLDQAVEISREQTGLSPQRERSTNRSSDTVPAPPAHPSKDTSPAPPATRKRMPGTEGPDHPSSQQKRRYRAISPGGTSRAVPEGKGGAQTFAQTHGTYQHYATPLQMERHPDDQLTAKSASKLATGDQSISGNWKSNKREPRERYRAISPGGTPRAIPEGKGGAQTFAQTHGTYQHYVTPHQTERHPDDQLNAQEASQLANGYRAKAGKWASDKSKTQSMQKYSQYAQASHDMPSLPGDEPSLSHRQGKEHAEPLSNQQTDLDPHVTQELARIEAHLLNDDIPESSLIIPHDGLDQPVEISREQTGLSPQRERSTNRSSDTVSAPPAHPSEDTSPATPATRKRMPGAEGSDHPSSQQKRRYRTISPGGTPRAVPEGQGGTKTFAQTHGTYQHYATLHQTERHPDDQLTANSASQLATGYRVKAGKWTSDQQESGERYRAISPGGTPRAVPEGQGGTKTFAQTHGTYQHYATLHQTERHPDDQLTANGASRLATGRQAKSGKWISDMQELGETGEFFTH